MFDYYFFFLDSLDWHQFKPIFNVIGHAKKIGDARGARGDFGGH